MGEPGAAVPDLEPPPDSTASIRAWWDALGANGIPLAMRARFAILLIRCEDFEARVKALQDVADGARRWLSETGRVHVNSMVGRGRTRAALARLDALLGAEEGEG